MQTPNLYRIILPVPDIERAVAFYGAVFDTPGRRVSPGWHYFSCGSTILARYDPVTDGDSEQDGWRFHPFQYYYFCRVRPRGDAGAVSKGRRHD